MNFSKETLEIRFWWILGCGFNFDTSCDRPWEVMDITLTEVLIALQGKCCQTLLCQGISLIK